MSIRATVCLIAILGTGLVCNDATAQRAKWGINQGFRFLGGGYSSGYHWRTPGPIVDYYTPWSAHNTHLRIGIIPQGARSYYNSGGYPSTQDGYDIHSPNYHGTSSSTPYTTPGYSTPGYPNSGGSYPANNANPNSYDLPKPREEVPGESVIGDPDTNSNSESGSSTENGDSTMLFLPDYSEFDLQRTSRKPQGEPRSSRMQRGIR